MKVFVVGGTGFVGTALVRRLVNAGHSVSALVRSAEKGKLLPAGTRIFPASPMTAGPWQEGVEDAEVIVNLAGSPIFTRWTDEAKKEIWESRIVSTQNVVAAIKERPTTDVTLINVSAAGYYGLINDEDRYENAPAGTDFLARLCVAWENEALNAKKIGCRVILPRFAVVLGPEGGALQKMLPAFRAGLGGRLGNGEQWFPWIHLADLVEIFLFLMLHPEISGPVNICAPQPLRNRDLTAAMAKIVDKPAFFTVPGFVLKLVLGELAQVFLHGTRMRPGVLTRAGFPFRFPTIDKALADLTAGL